MADDGLPRAEARRREYGKMVRQKAEGARVAIRNIRREEVQRVDRMQKDGDVPEDEAKRALERLQKITDLHVGRVEHLATAKESEVMEV